MDVHGGETIDRSILRSIAVWLSTYAVVDSHERSGGGAGTSSLSSSAELELLLPILKCSRTEQKSGERRKRFLVVSI